MAPRGRIPQIDHDPIHALSTVPSLLAVVLGIVIIGARLPWIIAGDMTLLQRRTLTSLMGRADAALGVLIGVPQTAAIAAGAALIALVDCRLMLVIMAIVTSAAAFYLLVRTIRQRAGTAVAGQQNQDPDKVGCGFMRCFRVRG